MQFSEDALKFLNLGINSEIAAYVFYKHAGAIVKEKELQDTLHKLANDEKGHFLSLEDLYDRNVRSEMWAPYKDILAKEGLPDIDELVQETHKELLSRIRGISTKREVLEMALMLEKEAFTLFSEAVGEDEEPGAKEGVRLPHGVRAGPRAADRKGARRAIAGTRRGRAPGQPGRPDLPLSG